MAFILGGAIHTHIVNFCSSIFFNQSVGNFEGLWKGKKRCVGSPTFIYSYLSVFIRIPDSIIVQSSNLLALDLGSIPALFTFFPNFHFSSFFFVKKAMDNDDPSHRRRRVTSRSFSLSPSSKFLFNFTRTPSQISNSCSSFQHRFIPRVQPRKKLGPTAPTP